jgi:hypothetical protein
MALFTAEQLRERAKAEIKKSSSSLSDLQTSTKIYSVLNEQLKAQKTQPKSKSYDIFLSHSSKDADLVEGLKLVLEDKGYSVYVDWIDDPQLNRSNVNRETALLIKERMASSHSLIYAFSENGSLSKWMPWELGYFDGSKGKAAILPIASNTTSDTYLGTEYLSIYNYVVAGARIYVHESFARFVNYDAWLRGEKP